MSPSRRLCLVCSREPAVRGTSRCEAHAIRRWANVNQSSRESYRAGWPARARQVLVEEPHCRGCGAPSTSVDHIVNKAHARELGWTEEEIEDRANLQALCRRCHGSKTAREGVDARRRKLRRGRAANVTGTSITQATSHIGRRAPQKNFR